MADATARIGHIARIARNQVDVEVEDRLARRCAAIDADVVAVGPVFLLDDRLGGVQCIKERGAFFRIGVEPRRYVAVGD